MQRLCRTILCNRKLLNGRQWLIGSNRNASVTVKVPPLGGETVKDGQIFFVKKIGDRVDKDEVIANIETEKINVPVLSPFSGSVEEIIAEEASTVKIGEDIFVVNDEIVKAVENRQETPPKANEIVDEQKEMDSKIPTKTEQIREDSTAPSVIPTVKTSTMSYETLKIKVNSKDGIETREQISRMRANIAKRLKESQNNAACLSTFNEIDMSSLIEMRKLYKHEFEDKFQAKLGFMSTFVTATVRALLEFPVLNAVIDGTDIVFRHYVDLGIAVSTDKGLVVPVLRNAEQLSYPAIEKAISDLAVKARSRQLSSDDLEGGTFTLTNTGVHGGLFGTPILNLNQSGILGIYKVMDRPVAVDGGKIEIRPMAYAALTYDHRLIDGEQAGRFLSRVKESVENPIRNLLRL